MESQYYRTFIAVPLRVDERFLLARKHLKAALKEDRISWTNPEQYHVTFRFIGDTEVSTVNEIQKSLQQGVVVPKRIRLETGGLASFGPRKKPRVIWVGFEENSFFDLLKIEVDRVLEQCGISLNEQPFKAHLTLGRIRGLQNLQHYYRTVEEMAQEFNSSAVFEKLVFFRSILGPGGPEYHVLEEMQFVQ